MPGAEESNVGALLHRSRPPDFAPEDEEPPAPRASRSHARRDTRDTRERERLMEDRMTTTMLTRVEEYEQSIRDAKALKERSDKDKYDKLLNLSVVEGEERVKAAKLRNKLLGLLVVIFGAVSTWVVAFKPPDTVAAVQPSDVQATVEAVGATEDNRLDKVETIQKASVEAILDQQVQIDESFRLVGDKLDAADKRSKAIKADAKDENGKLVYPAVIRARARADKIKAARGDSLLHDEIDVLLGMDGT